MQVWTQFRNVCIHLKLPIDCCGIREWMNEIWSLADKNPLLINNAFLREACDDVWPHSIFINTICVVVFFNFQICDARIAQFNPPAACVVPVSNLGMDSEEFFHDIALDQEYERSWGWFRSVILKAADSSPPASGGEPHLNRLFWWIVARLPNRGNAMIHEGRGLQYNWEKYVNLYIRVCLCWIIIKIVRWCGNDTRITMCRCICAFDEPQK